MLKKISRGSATYRGGVTQIEKYFCMAYSFLIKRGEEVSPQELIRRAREYYSDDGRTKAVLNEIEKMQQAAAAGGITGKGKL